MTLPVQSVTLTVEQVGELNKHLAGMRHDINNHLSLIIAVVEMIRHKPQTTERMLETLTERTSKITESLGRFSGDFERTMGITRR